MFKKTKNSIKKFLDKMAEQNKTTYGNKRLNCCDLNKVNSGKKVELK